MHVMEETITGLTQENKGMQQQLKEMQIKLEAEKEQKERVEIKCNKLVVENAELASTLTEVMIT